MADESKSDASKSTSPFDVRTVKSLVALMAQHDLAEIDLRDGTQRLRLRRGQQAPIMVSAVPAISSPAPAAVPPPAASPAKPDTPTVVAAPAKKLIEIKSVSVGTYYSAANPESPPFVRLGSKVTPETVVCIVEAMKVMNEITADCSGRIEEILVENQQPVEWGQVLFRVDPQG